MKTVEVTQYIRTQYSTVVLNVEMPDDVADMAREMTVSTDLTPDLDMAVFFAKKKTWSRNTPHVAMIANIDAGPNNPQIVLERLIRKVADMNEPVNNEPDELESKSQLPTKL